MALTWPIQKKGSSGEPVRSVQYLLRQAGSNVVVDGVFGAKTETAVKAFQTAKHLTADGIVGNKTWPVLIVTVRRGSKGEAVKAVQSQNNFGNQSDDPTLGLVIDGIFGAKTEAWVRGYQTALHAGDPSVVVDGIVGPVTWNNLVREVLSG